MVIGDVRAYYDKVNRDMISVEATGFMVGQLERLRSGVCRTTAPKPSPRMGICGITLPPKFF